MSSQHPDNSPSLRPDERRFSVDVTGLLEHHLAHLRDGSGLPLDVIRERGYRSVLDAAELARLGFGRQQRRPPGLLLPVWGPDGGNGLYQFRPDDPRVGANGRPIKYETVVGGGMRIDVPPRCRPMLADPTVPLWITEGIKKGDSLAAHGLCAVGLLGVWNWKGRNGAGGVAWLADWDYIAFKDRLVKIVFDSDIVTKPDVAAALRRLAEHLRRRGA